MSGTPCSLLCSHSLSCSCCERTAYALPVGCTEVPGAGQLNQLQQALERTWHLVIIVTDVDTSNPAFTAAISQIGDVAIGPDTPRIACPESHSQNQTHAHTHIWSSYALLECGHTAFRNHHHHPAYMAPIWQVDAEHTTGTASQVFSVSCMYKARPHRES